MVNLVRTFYVLVTDGGRVGVGVGKKCERQRVQYSSSYHRLL